MSITTGNQPPMRGHGILSMFLIVFILSLFRFVPPPVATRAAAPFIIYGVPPCLRLMHGSGFQAHYIIASPEWLPPSFQFSMVLPLRVSPVFFTVMV